MANPFFIIRKAFGVAPVKPDTLLAYSSFSCALSAISS